MFMYPTTSIIIPCYNSGQYLLEAIESIEESYPKDFYEIIIINDGSSDSYTINLLQDLENKKYTVIHQENKGPSSARNVGVRNAKGKYLFFLDSDNKVERAYLEKATHILNANDNIGVVYANPIFFGNNLILNRHFQPQLFNTYTLLLSNYIDMCSVVRKSCIDSVGGFDEDLVGHEDWELWIRIAKAGWDFFHINEALYYYRISEGSLTTIVDSEKDQIRLKYIYGKHHDLINKSITELVAEVRIYKDDQNKPFRSFLKYMYNKYFKK